MEILVKKKKKKNARTQTHPPGSPLPPPPLPHLSPQRTLRKGPISSLSFPGKTVPNDPCIGTLLTRALWHSPMVSRGGTWGTWSYHTWHSTPMQGVGSRGMPVFICLSFLFLSWYVPLVSYFYRALFFWIIIYFLSSAFVPRLPSSAIYVTPHFSLLSLLLGILKVLSYFKAIFLPPHCDEALSRT